MNYEQAVESLQEKYKCIFREKAGTPGWACKKMNGTDLIHCSIPFVGKNYFEQPVKLLVYASAENLNNYNGHIDDDMVAANRHRVYFEKNNHDTESFPNVHIQPFNNGALVLVACHIMSRLTDVKEMTPSNFLESIAFANYGKYTIDAKAAKRNADYAGDPDKLSESQAYIQADIEILKPDYIVMIGQMYNGKGKQKVFIDGIKGDAKVVPIYQITPTTINNPRTFRKFPPAKLEDLHPSIRQWYKNFNAGAISSPYFLSVFSYLDDVLTKVDS